MAQLIDRRAPSLVKHLYAGGCGVALAYWNFGASIAHCLLTTLVSWLLLVLLSPYRQRAIAVAAVFVFNALYLLIGYYYVSTEGYDVDWTLPQCVLCLRLIGLAYDVFDGGKPRDQLRSDQLDNHLVNTPALIDTFGYAFFFAAVLTGPQFPFRLYQSYIAGSLASQSVDSSRISAAQLRSSAIRAAITRFALGILYLAIVTVGQGLFPASQLDHLVEMPFLKALLYLTIIGNLGLRKYLAIWLINEGSCILSGISIDVNDGVTGKATDISQVNWGRVANVLPLTFELATNVNMKIASFNINTNDWCKRYIFKRLMWVGNKNVSTLAALLFLSLWHGFKPGYLFTFSAEFIVLVVQQRLIARHIRLGLDKSTLYSVLVCWPVCFLLAAYAYSPFETLTYSRTVQMFSGVYWYMHIAVFVAGAIDLAWSAVEPKPKSTKKDGDSTKTTNTTTTTTTTGDQSTKTKKIE